MQSSQQGQKLDVDSRHSVESRQNRYEQKRISNIYLRDHRVWSNLVLVVTILGVLVMLLGVVSSYLGFTSVAYVQVACGAITAVFPRLVHKPADESRQRIDNVYEDQIAEERFIESVEIAQKIEDPKIRDTVFQDLINIHNMRRQWRGREVPALAMGRQSNEMTPKSPTLRDDPY